MLGIMCSRHYNMLIYCATREETTRFWIAVAFGWLLRLFCRFGCQMGGVTRRLLLSALNFRIIV
jgi:hypothetical protein